ncbi:MAG: hypothetical protein IJX08_07845, partial [Clostridia bacterium]|nr:hypothetical protein [Clostridia bacterium]
MAHSFIMLYNEMQNSKAINRQLGANVEQQMLVNSIHSIIMEEHSAEEALRKVLETAGNYLHLDRISVYCPELFGDNLKIVSSWQIDEDKIYESDNYVKTRHREIRHALGGTENYFSKGSEVQISDFNLGAFAVSEIYGRENETAFVVYESYEKGRKWNYNDRKIVRSVSQSVSNIMQRCEMDNKIEEKNRLLLEKSGFEKDLARNERDHGETLLQIAELSRELEEAQAQQSALGGKKEECLLKKQSESARCEALARQMKALEAQNEDLKKENAEYERQSEQIRVRQKEKTSHREILLREYTKLDGALEAIKSEQERYTARLWDEYELTYAGSKELGVPEITESTRNEAVSRQNKLKNRIRDLGPVNVGAIEEYADVKERFDFLSGQYEDLTKAREELGGVIVSLEKEMRARFAEVFSAINDNFRSVFAELFGGGTAELSLNDPENILESGIEISVAPPGKIIKSLSLLSGGEQVFVAIALFFAILRVNPAPFCLLDEIEAALDEVNVARFASYAKNYSDKTQFIIISHRRGTMEQADTMYGVTMGERGISRVLPLHLSDVEAKTGMKI